MGDIGWGIDVGVGSLSLAVIELDANGAPIGLLDGAVEIFPASAGAAERRGHQSMRTQIQRRSARLRALKRRLIDLFDLSDGFDAPPPKAPKALKGAGADTSRVALRARGLREPLEATDLARAILHIAKNRGQRLTRAMGGEDAATAEHKAAQKEAAEAQGRAQWTADLLRRLGDERGLGRPAHPAELLQRDAEAGKPTRLRKDRPDAPVFTRAMVEAEFDALLATQAGAPGYGAVLTPDVLTDLRTAVFHEAEGKRPAIGKCRFRTRGADGGIEDRLPIGSDLFQTKRIYEEANNLRLIDPLTGAARALTLAERDAVAAAALAGRDVSGGTVRTLLKLGRGRDARQTSLDVAETGRKAAAKIKGHQIAAAFKRADALDLWEVMAEEERGDVADLLREEEDFERVRDALLARGLSPEAACAIANAPIAAGRSAAGPTATRLILEQLKADVISAYEATRRAGLEDPSLSTPQLDRLPYYGAVLTESCVGATYKGHDPLEVQFGRIPNPVVHQALNRLRRMGNAFLKRYGKPKRICIELARDLNKSADERAEDERRAAANAKKNDSYLLKLFEDAPQAKRKLSRDDRLKIKLHRLQNGRCLYTGQELSVAQLFDGSTAIDHILPRAETLDDGLANLALCTRPANDHKAKRTPFNAFSGGYQGREYAQILEQAKARGPGVFWRFQPDAMDRFKDRAEFRERFLVDTRYIGKAARRYLTTVCADPNGVVCVNGRLTSLLRRHWGLDGLIREIMEEDGASPPEALAETEAEAQAEAETAAEAEDPPPVSEQIARRREREKKLRLDHRHHLLDAVVAGCTTRRDVQRIHTIAGRFDRAPDQGELEQVIEAYLDEFRGAGLPWRPAFRAAVKALLTNDPKRYTGEARPASRVLRKPDHNARGKLHAASNYGAICRDPGDPSLFVVTQHKSLSDLAAAPDPAKALAGIVDMGRAEAILRAAVAAGAKGWWGGEDDPVASLTNLQRDLAGMRDAIRARAESAPESAGKSERERLKWAIERHGQETGRRRYTKVSVMTARILKPGPTPEARPLLLAPTKTDGSNHCLDIVRDKEGAVAMRVIARLDANQPGGLDPAPGETLLLRLHADDLVEMLDGSGSDARRRLYRLVSLSDGDLEFLPVEEARPVKQTPPGVRTRIASLKALRARKPAQVVLDGAGRVRWRSPALN